jgi:hypothetical protein
VIDLLQELLDRPISDGERRRLFVLAAVVVLVAAALLLVIGGGGGEGERAEQPQPSPPRASAPTPEPPPPAGVEGTTAPAGAPPLEARRVARRFLSGYLAFIYGQGPARAIDGADAGLIARLARSRVRVPPAARRREPRIAELLRGRSRGRERLQVTAVIDDGGVAQYPISLALTRRAGGSVVAEVAED